MNRMVTALTHLAMAPGYVGGGLGFPHKRATLLGLARGHLLRCSPRPPFAVCSTGIAPRS